MGKIQHTSAHLETLFKQCFAQTHRTLLCGGADEPLYQPSSDPQQTHRIFYRDDYFASALHEVAHWCIAGNARRQLLDYGYWYSPDGRNEQQQMQFEQVECKPQAIEWAFSLASNKAFSVSIDNLNGETGDAALFTEQVWQQLKYYAKSGFPPRAQCFVDALQKHYRSETSFSIKQVVCQAKTSEHIMKGIKSD